MDSLEQRGFNSLLRRKGRRLKSQDDAGIEFLALLTTVSPVDPDFPLGQDPRSLTKIQVAFDVQLAMNVIVEDLVTRDKWTVIKRDNTAADRISNDFWGVEKTGNDK